MKVLTAAFIGLGARGFTYASLMSKLPDQVRIVACADIDPERLQRFGDRFQVQPSDRYHGADEILAQEHLADLMVIATQDRQHTRMAIAAMEKGYDILCEKPISPFLEDCLLMEKTARETGRTAVVCHVLRYSPFFLTIKHLLDEERIGTLVAIEMTEKVAWWHQAHSFVRGNWRSSRESSPMILQKSCHDMDILLWLTGKHCLSVSSVGSLKHFTRENAPAGAHERCSASCPQYKTCPYSLEVCYLRRAREENYFGWPTDTVTSQENLQDLQYQLETGPYGRCVYFCDNDVVDHQHVNLQLEDQVTASFTMSGFTSGHGRRIHIMGTHGDIIGELDDAHVELTPFGKPTEHFYTTVSELAHYGHGGGDMGMIMDVLSLLRGDKGQNSSITSIQNSVESHVVALAAEESRVRGGELIRISDFAAVCQ